MSELTERLIRLRDSIAREQREDRDTLADAVNALNRLVDLLYDCAEHAGRDLSGTPRGWAGWDPAEAVDAVKELRADYDECPAPEDLEQLREALERIATTTTGRRAREIARAVLDQEGRNG